MTALLCLCQVLPYPPDAGVAIRTYNILQQLADSYDLTMLCFYRWKGGAMQSGVQRNVEALGALGTAEAFSIPQEHSRVRMLADHTRSVLTGRPYTYYTYQSRSFGTSLGHHLSERTFGMVHVDSMDLVAYLPRLVGRLPVACTHHNVESQLLRRRAAVERRRTRRNYLTFQAGRLERAERHWAPRVDLNVCCSTEDATTLERLVPGARTVVVPNGVDVQTFQPSGTADDGIVFVGGTTWFPNRDALEYFCADILPLIRERRPGVPVRWVGRATAEEQRHYRRRHNVELTGYVDDIRPYVGRAACFVVPLRVGGGTRLKILDAWALGKALVTTSVGAEGLEARHGHNALVADTPAAFAAAVCQVLDSRELRQALGSAARQTAVERYSWDRIGEDLRTAYAALMTGAEVPA